MNIDFHPGAIRDVREIKAYYMDISQKLADEFMAELETVLLKAIDNPEHFHFERGTDYRRANLSRFPYHALYRVKDAHVRVFVIKHDKRNPSYGIKRK